MKTLICTYTSGIKAQFTLPDQMIHEWLDCFRENKKIIFLQANDIVGINTANVVDFRLIEGAAELYHLISPLQITSAQEEDPADDRMAALENAYAQTNMSTTSLNFKISKASRIRLRDLNIRIDEFDRSIYCYFVNCRCGHSYEYISSYLKNKGLCHKCRTIVFTDILAGWIPSPLSSKASLEMTNIRRVNNDATKEFINILKMAKRSSVE